MVQVHILAGTLGVLDQSSLVLQSAYHSNEPKSRTI